MTPSLSYNFPLYSFFPDSTSQILPPPLSTSTNFAAPPFLLKQQPFFMPPFRSSASAMAASCVSSRTETPSHKFNDEIVLDNYYVKYCRPYLSDVPSNPVSTKTKAAADLWVLMKDEARAVVDQEPILSNYYFTSILSHDSMESGLANHMSMKLSDSTLPVCALYDLFLGVLNDDQEITRAVCDDLVAVRERDPACIGYVHCFLNYKGFLACQSHRVGHNLWREGRKMLALLIQNRVSEVLAVDIHPGARIGRGILLDHATGVVIGETAVIGDNVSILHNVTLGGTGKASGDRHPKIGDGVLIGAGTCVLGNVIIEEGAKIGAGSVVLKQVPARTTAVGNPARLIGGKNPTKLDKMPSFTMDQTSHISDWSDYVI